MGADQSNKAVWGNPLDFFGNVDIRIDAGRAGIQHRQLGFKIPHQCQHVVKRQLLAGASMSFT